MCILKSKSCGNASKMHCWGRFRGFTRLRLRYTLRLMKKSAMEQSRSAALCEMTPFSASARLVSCASCASLSARSRHASMPPPISMSSTARARSVGSFVFASSSPQGPRPQVRPAGPGGPVAGDVARELRAPRRARLRDARPRLPGDARGRRGGAAGRLRRGGRAHRRTRPDAGAHREGARREGRCPAGLAWKKNGIDGPTVRLSLGRGAGRRAEHGHRTHRNTSPPFLQLGKRRPRAPGGATGAFG